MPCAAARLALAAACCAARALALRRRQRAQRAPPPAPRRRRRARRRTGRSPNFVVIQTDDQTLDQLYATYTPPGGAPILAMPNTLALIAGKGRHLQPLLRLLPALLPLAGQPADRPLRPQPQRPRQRAARTAATPASPPRGAYSHNIATWLQGAGYRTIHIGKFLNGYGDEPFDNGNDGAARLERLAHGPQRRHRPLLLRLHAQRQRRRSTGPSATPAAGKRANTAQRDDFGCPFAPLNGQPCLYETDVFNRIASEEMHGTPPEQPFYLQLDYTAPHGDFRRPAGPEPATRHYDSFAGAPFPHSPSQGFNEGNVNDKPRFIREAPYLSPNDIHTYRVYYQKALESLRSVDDGVKQIVDTLGGLHRLRNTYIIFTSDNGFFYGEHRLTGGKFLAYEPSTHLPFLMRGPGHQTGHPDRRAGGQHRHRPDDPRTGPRRRRTRASTAARSSPTCTTPACARRRPILFESFVETNDVEENGGGPAAAPAGVAAGNAGGGARRQRPAASGASASIVAPPKDY